MLAKPLTSWTNREFANQLWFTSWYSIMFVSLFALQGKEKNPQKRDSIESWGVPMAAKTKEACDQGGGLWWHHRFWSQRRFTAFCWPLGWQAEERKRTPEEKGPCEPILACIPTTDNDVINLWSSNQIISLLEFKLPCHAPNMPISISEEWKPWRMDIFRPRPLLSGKISMTTSRKDENWGSDISRTVPRVGA